MISVREKIRFHFEGPATLTNGVGNFGRRRDDAE